MFLSFQQANARFLKRVKGRAVQKVEHTAVKKLSDKAEAMAAKEMAGLLARHISLLSIRKFIKPLHQRIL
jgi:predicted RNA-binding protein